MEQVYEAAGKSTKKGFSRVQLADHGWNEAERTAFTICKDALTHQITLAHRDPSQRLYIYTDASDLAWSSIITQVSLVDLGLLHVDERHSPLSFVSV